MGSKERPIMSLKFKFKTKDEIPADHLPLYAERDGVWMLDVEGAVDKSKLDEFRTTNVSLLKERDELKQRFDGIDPDQVRELMEAQQKAEEERLLNPNGTPHPGPLPSAEREKNLNAGREQIEKVIEARLKTIKGDFDKQLTSISSERDDLNARLSAVQIDQAAVAAATKRGLRSTAISDLTSRARGLFKLSSGLPTAFEADGSTVRPGKDGISPMSLEEWVDSLVSDAPHLFEANSGGGAGGNTNANGSGGAGRGIGGKNPFKRESWNLTEQMKLAKADPQLAARLKASA